MELEYVRTHRNETPSDVFDIAGQMISVSEVCVKVDFYTIASQPFSQDGSTYATLPLNSENRTELKAP